MVSDDQRRLATKICRGEEIIFGGERPSRVLAVVPFEDGDESLLVGLLQVEAA